MSALKKLEDGVLLFDAIYIGEGEKPSWALLTLRTLQWDPIVYDKDREKIIDYPGEYELSGYRITALCDPKDTKISYLISFSNKKVAYLQSSKILDDERVTDMDIRYITNPKLHDQIEKRELEWEIQMVE